jgi:hypothetical protein
MRIFAITNITYFHGSYDKLPRGTVLSPEHGNFMKTFEDFEMEGHFKLEQFKPAGSLSRNECIFMTDNIDDIDNAGGATDHIYIVNPIGKTEIHDLGWMSEIDVIISDSFDNGEQDSPETLEKIKQAALNYWAGVPFSDDPVWEYLAKQAVIVKEV